ncbi:MAG: CRISPR-associated helicase Cas3', partial [Candidatus Thorarchaeota archaeon]
MSPLKARPHQSLRVHNKVVASGTLSIIRHIHPFYESLALVLGDVGAQERFEQLVQMIALCHDFGKSSPVFQRKVSGENISVKENPLSYHTHVGSLLGFIATKQLLSDVPEDVCMHLSGIVMSIILQHHSPQSINPLPTKTSPISLIERLRDSVEDTDQILRLLRGLFDENPGLIESIYPHAHSVLSDSIRRLLELEIDGLLCLLDEIEDTLEVFRKNTSLDDYILYRLLYSALCDMDEYDAAFSITDTGKHSVVRDLPRTIIPDDIIDQFREKQLKQGVWQTPKNERESRIKKLREDTYQVTVQAVEPTSKIVSLQAPTGSGKTLAMISYALKLRDEISRQQGTTPRIIYALPFISIAEQVESVVRDIFGIEHRNSDELLTVHHSLSEMKWYSESEDYTPRNIRFLLDRWRSDIIITTTVRLCETIFGPSKNDSIRFNRLAGAIILMDEVQSFPVRYWDIIAEMVVSLTRQLGCHVLLATATMPAILHPSDMHTLSVNRVGISRYNVHYNSIHVTLDEFAHEIFDVMRARATSNILVVVNTKAAAEKMYSTIHDNLSPDDTLYFLSGWVAPIHRKQTIVSLRESLISQKSRVILVCTQVIEAGVDVTFDIVFRDLAPLDSIVQVAGRCNRHWENKEPGIVNIRYIFDSEKKQSYAGSVYGDVDLEMTR